MKADFLAYWNSLWNDIPIWVYETGILVFIAGLVICSLTYGIRKGLRYSLGLLLIEYIILIYCSTVFFRNTGKLQYDFMPFWSYRDYFNGVDKGLLTENIMNVVAFVPVGLLLGMMIRSKVIQVTETEKISSKVPKIVEKRWKRGWLAAILVGAGLSIGIEMLQLVFKRGFSEVDDVMHNTLGCLIGYGIYLLVRVGWKSRACLTPEGKRC